MRRAWSTVIIGSTQQTLDVSYLLIGSVVFIKCHVSVALFLVTLEIRLKGIKPNYLFSGQAL